MEISEIKSRLTLSTVIKHYGLKADKQNRICCPFHEDKTPSMQLYWKTHTAYCFSSNCSTHGKSMDVIDFIKNMEKCNKHEAIKKAQTLIDGNVPAQEFIAAPKSQTTPIKLQPIARIAVLTKMFIYFKNAVHNSQPAREYIKSRALDYTQIEIGYNTAQFHHGARRDEQLIKSCLEVGLLYEAGTNSRIGGQAYGAFGKWGIVFALKNKENQIVSMYFRSTVNNDTQKHYYLKDRQGLYPHYPKSETKKLILTEAIIDAATLLRIPEITSQYEILSCYGTNGLTDEHRAAIKELKELNEIIFAFDADPAGKEATEKYSRELKEQHPHIAISSLQLPCTDINETAQGHSPDIFTHLLHQRINFFLSTEKNNPVPSPEKKSPDVNTIEEKQKPEITPGKLNTANPHNIHYISNTADYYTKGGIKNQLDAMKISLQIVSRENRSDYRTKIDLYEHKQIESTVKAASEKLNIQAELLAKDLSTLTGLLETYRNEQLQKQANNSNLKPAIHLPEETMNDCITLLKTPNLIEKINELIGKSGVVGEQENRVFLFVIAASYKMRDTLHALIQGSSGSGKTRLLKTICELMPQEDTIRFTRVTDSSFYNYPENYLVNKLLGFEDIDGMKEDALYAVRELISNEILVSSTSTKTEDGQISSAVKTVRGPIASISCTTKGEIYEDNMSRVFLIAVDESKEQTRKIIHYQQQKAAGTIDYRKEKQLREFIQNCIRLLKPYDVINPFAHKIQLPEEAHKIRRLNDLYLSFVKQITLINQYQRKKDEQGRLITTKEDLQVANGIMFESILLKIDELDGSLRQFYERLKLFVKEQKKKNNSSGTDDFQLRDVRQALNISKTQLHRYIFDLMQLEYIQPNGGFANKGFRYKITYWDDIELLRSRIKKYLQDQIDSLDKKENKKQVAFHKNGTLNGTLQTT